VKTATIATAAAIFALTSLATATPSFAAPKAEAAKTHCYGVNSCKGQSDCKSGNHDCKGMNDCKGQGFKDLTAKACAAAGGSETPK
jgi:uncharacterized membrane protein